MRSGASAPVGTSNTQRLPPSQNAIRPVATVSIAQPYSQNARTIRDGGHRGAALPTQSWRQTLTEFRRKEFAITETEDKAIAAAAIMGDRRSPVIG